MTFKNHMGVYFLINIISYVIWVSEKDTRNKFEWYIPASGSLVIFLFIEFIGWGTWFFFIY